MFAPVLGGLSTHGLRKATGKEKPPQYDLKWAQYSVTRNAESLGIDPASIVGYWPMWAGAGGVHNIFYSVDVTALKSGFSWQKNYLNVDGSQSSGLGLPHNTAERPDNGPFSIVVVSENIKATIESAEILSNTADVSGGWSLKTEQYNDTGKIGFSKHSVRDLVSFLNSSLLSDFSVWGVVVDENNNPIIYHNGITDDLFDSQSIEPPSSPANIYCCGKSSGSDILPGGDIYTALLLDKTIPFSVFDFLYTHPYYLLQPVPMVRFFDMGAAEGLTFNSIIQGQTVVSPTLAQLQNLGISSVAQSQTVDSPDVSQIHQITTDAIRQGQTIDSLSLQQMISLSIDAINQGQSVDQVTISQLQQLAIDSVKQSQGVDSLTVDQLISLTINNISHGQLVDSPALTVPGELIINSIVQGQNVVSPTLQQAQGLLDVANVSQGQSVSALSLEQVHSLITDSINQGQIIDTTGLDQIISLAIDSVSQGQTLSEPSFYSVTVLDIDSIQQGQTVEATSVSQVSQLIIDEISQGQVIENINFSIAKGRLQITITGKKPGVDFNGKAPTTKFQ